MAENSIGIEKTIAGGGTSTAGGYTLASGDTLGQYKIVRPLGKGGMGEVYLCEHAILTTRHAVKLLPAERSSSEGFLQRFHDEARVMARLQHSGIVHVTHADEQDSRHYLVMDFVGADGTDEPFDLEDALAAAPDNRLEPVVVARLCKQIAEAVGSAHKAGVVHRDLKPANVLLTSRDLTKADVRVADFGLARLLGEDWLRSIVDVSMRQSMSIGDGKTMVDRPRAERSTTGSILGTYEYMSPEQREGRDADGRSDIYALGVMLYRLITGKRLMGMAKPPSRIVKGLDAGWDDLVGGCLEEDPADRPADMASVAKLLTEIYEAEAKTKEQEDSRRQEESAQRAEAARAELERERRRQEAEEARLAAESRAKVERDRQLKEEVQRKKEAEQRTQAASEQDARTEKEDAAQRQTAEPPVEMTVKKSSGGRKFALLAFVAAVIGAVVWIGNENKPTGSQSTAARPSARATSPAPGAAVATPAESVPRREASTSIRGPVAGRLVRIDDLGMELVPVGAGSFQMGSNDGSVDEKPVRTVRITRDFWMGKTEVTQKQYQQLMGRNPSHFKGEDLPVEMVSWNDAIKFCEELTKRERAANRLPSGYVYRLPTEAEWEYAARGGAQGRSTAYAGSDNLDSVAWHSGNSGSKTQRVGMKAANELGLHDMSGNVWEWCHDWYQDSYNGLGTTDPSGPSSGSGRVRRGGGWFAAAPRCRVAFRYDNTPSYSISRLGFRLVLAAPVQ